MRFITYHKKMNFLLISSLILLSSFHSQDNNEPFKKSIVKTIIVDAGHGYPDPGAQGSFSNEADINLAIALKLGEKLKKALPDCNILYTRTDRNLPAGLKNKDEANKWRARFANENKGDLYISIHVNDVVAKYGKRVIGTKEQTYTTYVGKGKSRKKVTRTRTVNEYETYRLPCASSGTQTYVWSLTKNEEKKGYINEEVSKEFDADSTLLIEDEETRILSSIYLKKYLNRSRTLAEMVEDEFRKKGIKSGGGAMQFTRGIRVLGATAMPSILVETGFICNRQDEQYLNSSEGQETLADGVFQAVLKYKSNADAGKITETAVN